ncbi:hypothetical protein Fot_37464 [Forsythia ovata]|uniref:Uncharacterized protein n=1 Tax=Forsythia ovata TaxID=205694 RepID=A0ABD1RZ27_9LAMI
MRTALEDIVVMAEPVKAIFLISKLAYNASYFRMVRKKRIENLTEVLNLGNSDSETEEINFIMAKLTPEEAVNLQKQMKESLRQKKGKWVAESSGQQAELRKMLELLVGHVRKH